MTYEHYRNLVSKIVTSGIKYNQTGKETAQVIERYRAKAIAGGLSKKDCIKAEADAIATAEILYAYAQHENSKNKAK